MAIVWIYLSGGVVATWTNDDGLTLAERLPAIAASAVLAGLTWAGALAFAADPANTTVPRPDHTFLDLSH